jgi:(p)ppGpp synthase/HD superfamily hydrolase
MDDIEDALTMAVEAHRGQKDRGGASYILHPLRVMAQMATDQERIVALLHDAVEDSPVTLAEIEARFGGRISAAVDAVTKRERENYDTYLARVKADEIARNVKLADLKDNSDLSRLGREPEYADRQRLDKYLRAQAILSTPVFATSAAPAVETSES